MKQEIKNKPQNKKDRIDFIELFKQAGLLVWQNRFLLWFGILMALGSPGGINYSFSEEDLGEKGKTAQNFFATHWKLAAILAVAGLVIGIIIFLVSLAGKAGLIRSVHSLALGQQTGFKKGWKEGKKYIVRLLKISILFFLTSLILILILAVPVVFLLVAHSWISALFVGLLAIAIFIPLIFILSFTAMFAEFYVVLSNISVWSAVEAGYNLFLKNIASTIIFGLLTLAVNMLAGVVMLPVVGIAFLLFVPAGLLFYFLNKIIFGIYAALAVFLFALIVLFFSSVFITLTTTAKILFFKKIAEIKTEEEAKAIDKILEEETSPVSGQA